MKSSKSALEKAVDYLSACDYSVRRLTDKLYRCGYNEPEIRTALDRLLERGYLNDAELCRRQSGVYLRDRRYSIAEIKHKLAMKGFSAETVSACLSEDLSEYEKESACNILKSRLKKEAAFDKYLQYLYRRGFSASSIRYAADKLANSE